MEKERQEAQDRYDDSPKCNWLSAIFTLGIDCIIKAKAKMRAEKVTQRIAEEKAELERTLTPLMAKIDTIKDIGTILWKAGTKKLEAVENFLLAIENANDYFNRGGRLFHRAARKKHIKKLD